ncbi:unnamed protein product, partial [Adineta steineri]
MGLSFLLTLILITQLIVGLCNIIASYRQKAQANQCSIFNLYLFHHLIICIIRCLTIFIICISILIYNECLSLGFFIHFLLLLSTFDLFTIIIGETVHFWDSTINHKSTLYSKNCLIFGIFLIYFLSSLFLFIHIILGGNNPLILNLCKSTEQKLVFNLTNDYEKSLIPTIIIYLLFILANLLTFLWICISYKDIYKLKHKRLATILYYSFVLTEYTKYERTKLINQSLKRLLSICLFILSNIIVILPVLTMKILNITLNYHIQIIFIFLTVLPWCESITFVFFDEMQSYKSDIIKRCLPNHHSLGELLLPCFLRQLFTLTVLFTLLCFLVSYALAGSQAFATLFRVPYVTMIPVFCWTWAFVIIFLHAFIQPIISVFTLLKALLFTGTVVVTLLVGLKIRNPVHDDYSAMGDSFLMSTIALGGLMNVMPLMFSKIKQTREEIIGFNTALFLGLTTCVILNILWCWSILAIVPQESTCLSSSINDTIQMAVNLLNESQTQGHCVLSSSLAKAQSDGEISTVPLSKILDNGDYHYFKYVSFIVQLFIVTSISVSFLTMGSALHHTIKGVVDAYWNPTLEAETNLRKYGNAFEYITVRRIIQWIFSIIIFALVFGIAMSNPKGFITILEEAASLFQNIEIGLFLAIMTYKVTSHEYSKYTLPFQLPR